MTETIAEGETVLYLDTSHIANFKYDEYSFERANRKIHVTHEPNELFVRYEITNVARVSQIVYSIENEHKTFKDFVGELKGREIDHILVYFIRYNETPLYLSIFLKSGENADGKEILERRINYKLDKNGLWKKAAHFALVFNDLRELAYEHDMFQYFEIENSDKYCIKKNYSIDCVSSRARGSNTGDYKVYTHTSSLKKDITSLFLYRKKIIKSLIITSKRITHIEVYYDKDDHYNRLPLLIVIYKEGEKEQYFINEGGNYTWNESKPFEVRGDQFGSLSLTLKLIKDYLMGTKATIDIGYEFEETYETQTYFNKLHVFLQDRNELGYKPICYTDEGKRFTITELRCENKPIVLPELPIYSVLQFYVFHHGSHSYPLFLCAVHEVKHDKIFVWYELENRTENKYRVCYFLAEDPKHFTNYKPIINMFEAKFYNLDVELLKTLSNSYTYGIKKLTNIGGINFHVTYQKKHPAHNRYILTPAFSNYFSINSLLAYDKKVETVNFKSVKEIHVFEHSNQHHYKVCISTAEYNYITEGDNVDFRWFEIRRNTNKGTDWTVVGHPEIKMTPDDFNDQWSIASLMDERISFYKNGKDVVYLKPANTYDVPTLDIKYNTAPEVEYKAGDHWPPIKPEITVYGPGNVYTTQEYDPETGIITGYTPKLPGQEGGITPLVGGLIGSGAGVGIVGVTTGYVLYSHMGTITSAITSIFH